MSWALAPQREWPGSPLIQVSETIVKNVTGLSFFVTKLYITFHGGSKGKLNRNSQYAPRGQSNFYVPLFSWEFYPHPPPRNANNVEPYTFVTLFSGKADTPLTALRNT